MNRRGGEVALEGMEVENKGGASSPNPSSSMFPRTQSSPGRNFQVGPTEIDPSEIVLTKVLGDGSFGTVYAGKCRQKDVAIKILLNQNLDEKTLEAFRHEVEVMSKIFHPNINLFMGACTVPGKLMIVTELMKGDLETMLEENKQITLLTRLKMAKDAALGVLWLHSSNPQIIHRDLKASNLLFDENLTCKVCDFGLSQIKPQGTSLTDPREEGAKGTPLWMAPEVMRGDEFNEKADVYSFGLILWFLLTCKEPYDEFDELEKFSHAVCIQGVRPPIPQETDKSLSNLIQACWAHKPELRPSFNEIVQSLNYIIVDCAILDDVGRQFWKQFFLEKDKVHWNEFLNTFSSAFQLLPECRRFPMTELIVQYPKNFTGTTLGLDIRCLKALLAPKNARPIDDESFVTLEDFGNMLNWFGPLTNISIMFQKIRQLLSCPWFHGDISTQESENRLLNKGAGSFLVRFSTSSPGCYTISKVSLNDNSIKHQKILRQNGMFEIKDRPPYHSLMDLINTESKELNLTSPCAGSRFLWLFSEPKVFGYVE